MYLSISVENFVTIGLMLVVWMIVIHLIGQFGVIALPQWMKLGAS